MNTQFHRGNNNARRPFTGKYVVNRQIRFPQVLCIDQNNKNLGVMKTEEALALAQSCELDLVIISNDRNNQAPICKILDFGKYRYEQDKKEKAAKKKQRENEIRLKEVKLHPHTSENDLLTKAKQMVEFVDEGNKLKVTVVFKGRELCHKHIGMETLNKFITLLGCGKFEGEPTMTGKNLIATVIKKETSE